jgi:hypothetical protein
MAMTRCKECGETVSERALACPKCGAPGPKSPLFGYEYRYPADAEGLPLVHIATGIDPQTGRKRIARGVIAIGDVAVGVVAMGGVSLGGITFGGVSVGVIAFGGLSIGAGLALGGLAIGTVAVGGMAIGYYALGGGCYGPHVLSGIRQDPEAVAFFRRYLPFLVPSWVP